MHYFVELDEDATIKERSLWRPIVTPNLVQETMESDIDVDVASEGEVSSMFPLSLSVSPSSNKHYSMHTLCKRLILYIVRRFVDARVWCVHTLLAVV